MSLQTEESYEIGIDGRKAVVGVTKSGTGRVTAIAIDFPPLGEVMGFFTSAVNAGLRQGVSLHEFVGECVDPAFNPHDHVLADGFPVPSTIDRLGTDDPDVPCGRTPFDIIFRLLALKELPESIRRARFKILTAEEARAARSDRSQGRLPA